MKKPAAFLQADSRRPIRRIMPVSMPRVLICLVLLALTSICPAAWIIGREGRVAIPQEWGAVAGSEDGKWNYLQIRLQAKLGTEPYVVVVPLHDPKAKVDRDLEDSVFRPSDWFLSSTYLNMPRQTQLYQRDLGFGMLAVCVLAFLGRSDSAKQRGAKLIGLGLLVGFLTLVLVPIHASSIWSSSRARTALQFSSDQALSELGDMTVGPDLDRLVQAYGLRVPADLREVARGHRAEKGVFAVFRFTPMESGEWIVTIPPLRAKSDMAVYPSLGIRDTTLNLLGYGLSFLESEGAVRIGGNPNKTGTVRFVDANEFMPNLTLVDDMGGDYRGVINNSGIQQMRHDAAVFEAGGVLYLMLLITTFTSQIKLRWQLALGGCLFSYAMGYLFTHPQVGREIAPGVFIAPRS